MTITPVALLTTAQVCDQLQISRVTVWRWAQAGRLNPIRITSRSTRYQSDDIQALIDNDPDGDIATLRDAVQLMAEQQAQETRPLCPECGKRRVNRQGSHCKHCTQQREDDLMDKLAWYQKQGRANDIANGRQHQRQETDDGA